MFCKKKEARWEKSAVLIFDICIAIISRAVQKSEKSIGLFVRLRKNIPCSHFSVAGDPTAVCWECTVLVVLVHIVVKSNASHLF